MLLARAGVGRLTLIDRDYVERSNLQRQILFDESDAAAALPKAIAAQRRLSAINSEIEIRAIVEDLDSRNVADLLGGADVILDATDNFETRYLINDWAVRESVPWIYGAAVGSYGITHAGSARTGRMLPLYLSGASLRRSADLRDRGRAESGDHRDRRLAGSVRDQDPQRSRVRRLELRIVTMDVWTGAVRSIAQPARDPECPCCGARDFEHLERSRRAPVSLCGRNAVQIHDRRPSARPGAIERQARAAGSRARQRFCPTLRARRLSR